MFWNELHLTPLFKEGHLTYFLGVQNDITRRKEAEAGQALMLQAVENANEAVLVTEARHESPGPRIEYANQAFTRMSGYELEEVVGQTPRMFQGPETDRTVLDRLRRQLERGELFGGEAVNYRKDGGPYVVAWHVAPIHDENGNVVNWVSTQRDVTERRRLERLGEAVAITKLPGQGQPLAYRLKTEGEGIPEPETPTLTAPLHQKAEIPSEAVKSLGHTPLHQKQTLHHKKDTPAGVKELYCRFRSGELKGKRLELPGRSYPDLERVFERSIIPFH